MNRDRAKGNKNPRAFSPCGPVEPLPPQRRQPPAPLRGMRRYPPDPPSSCRGFGRAGASLPQSRHAGEPSGPRCTGVQSSIRDRIPGPSRLEKSGRILSAGRHALGNCSHRHPWLWMIADLRGPCRIPAEWGSPDARAAGGIVTLAAELAPPFSQRLSAAAAETDRLLDRLLASAPCEHEILRPKRLLDAVRYASLGGGKRIRPFLVVETAALFEAPRERALMVGAALECVHCYSLVHDDLPAMDNDDLRRGQPTVHKAFDEATAILAGDALLTLAFEILAGAEA